MAHASEQVKRREEKGKFRIGIRDKVSRTSLKRKRDEGPGDEDGVDLPGEAIAEGERAMKKKRKRGPKEPNPLSVKKKKTTSSDADTRPQAARDGHGGGDSSDIDGAPGSKKRRRRKHSSAQTKEISA
jgi:U3 small nucleolar RNA-associated protein 23